MTTAPAQASEHPVKSTASLHYAAWLLWLVWAGLLFGGFIFGTLSSSGRSQIPTFCRMGSSVTLVLAGAVWAAAAWPTRMRNYGVLIALGMFLGFLGDLSNADLLGIPEPTIGGILFFGIGHMAYIAGCVSAARVCGLRERRAFWPSLFAWESTGLIGWAVIVLAAGNAGVVHWAALPYSLLLAGTAACATSLALQRAAFISLAVGAALFLMSDMILAWDLFRGSFPHIGDFVWLTYGPGQMLIVYSVPAAMRALRR